VKRDRLRDTTYDLSWVQDYRRARRIAKREFKRLREPVRGTLDLKLSGINACYERWIYLGDTGIPGLSNRYIENRSARFNLAAGGLRMEFLGADASIDDWTDTEADEGLEPPLLDDTPGGALYMPANVTACLETFTPLPGVSAQRIVVEFDQPPEGAEYEYRTGWRRVTDGDQPGRWHDKTHTEPPEVPEPNRFQLKTDAVESDQGIELAIATIATKGGLSKFNKVTINP